jgi:hypothetical protein
MEATMLRRSFLAAALGGSAASALLAIKPALADPRPEYGVIITRVPGALIRAAIEGAFRGTSLRLDNYGPRHGNSWHQANASRLALGPALGGATRTFTIPEARKGPFRYYVNDVNLAGLAAGFAGDRLKLNFRFEKRGTEIKGRCGGGVFDGCVAGSDSTAPDVQWEGDASLDLLLRPVALDGSLSYDRATVRLNGRFQAGGACRAIDVCNLVAHYKERIRESVEGPANAILTSADIRRRVAAALRPVLDRVGIGEVRFVRIDGDTVNVHHRPRSTPSRMG